jgi:uncharacterized protein with HEPN domain
MRDDRERLRDILAAIDHIDQYAVQGPSRFQADELIQAWFLRHLQIIGEACRSLSESLKNSHPAVPWSKIIGMRHILVHDYFDIDLPLVWNVVARELPQLRQQVTAILKTLEGN